MQELKQFVIEWIETNQSEFYQTADLLWNSPELGMEEYNSSSLLVKLLEKYGFTVKTGVAGIPTAFVATFGNGKPVIGFNAEYDALPGLSQENIAQKQPIFVGAPGHGCGHNLLGVGAVKAVIALKNLLENKNITATLKVFGTPAEELCIGKPFMARAGLFKGVDAFIDWHPGTLNRADYDRCNAYFSVKYHYKGKACHGNAPWKGRSTLDAAILQTHAVEILREHIPPSDSSEAPNTINYTISDVGPEFPSVVPDRTTSWYIGRFYTTELMSDVIQRVNKCAQAAALATDTKVNIELITATHDKIPNQVLATVMNMNLKEIGPPRFTKKEHSFAKRIQKTCGAATNGLDETIRPFGGGSSVVCDTSEFSWFAPYATAWITMAPSGVGWHNWIATSCSGSSLGKKAMEVAAKVLATTAVDLIGNPTILEAAHQELEIRLAGREYNKLIPDMVNPPLDINASTMAKYRFAERK